MYGFYESQYEADPYTNNFITMEYITDAKRCKKKY